MTLELCITLGTTLDLFPPLLGVLFELYITLRTTLEIPPLLLVRLDGVTLGLL
jgi:hypothetical protein